MTSSYSSTVGLLTTSLVRGWPTGYDYQWWLRLPVVPTKTFSVWIANGEILKCQGRFKEVRMDLQGTHFSLTLYFLPLTGLDLVLGIQWLKMLGSMVCNWKQLTMEFLWENQIRRLQGTDDEVIQAASLKELSKDRNYLRSLQVYHLLEKLITTSPSKKKPNQLMSDRTVMRTIKRRRSRNKSIIC